MSAKAKTPKARNAIALMMILHRKGGKHRDRRREFKDNPPRDD